MKNAFLATLSMVALTFAVTIAIGDDAVIDDSVNEIEKVLVDDLALIQGTWELLHGNQGDQPPTTRSVKTISGNSETLRRYNIETGELTREHSVDFRLSKSGSVRVFTFYSQGGSPEDGWSYIYKVDESDFYDIPGMLHGDQYRNYQRKPTVWRWKRITSNDAAASSENESD